MKFNWYEIVKIIATAIVSIIGTLTATSCLGLPNPFSN